MRQGNYVGVYSKEMGWFAIRWFSRYDAARKFAKDICREHQYMAMVVSKDKANAIMGGENYAGE